MNLVSEFYGLTLDTPTIILPLFLSTMLTVHVQQLGGTARVIRADCRTENGYVAAVQRFIMMMKMIGRGMTVSSMKNQFLTNESKPGEVYWEKIVPLYHTSLSTVCFPPQTLHFFLSGILLSMPLCNVFTPRVLIIFILALFQGCSF